MRRREFLGKTLIGTAGVALGRCHSAHNILQGSKR